MTRPETVVASSLPPEGCPEEALEQDHDSHNVLILIAVVALIATIRFLGTLPMPVL